MWLDATQKSTKCPTADDATVDKRRLTDMNVLHSAEVHRTVVSECKRMDTAHIQHFHSSTPSAATQSRLIRASTCQSVLGHFAEKVHLQHDDVALHSDVTAVQLDNAVAAVNTEQLPSKLPILASDRLHLHIILANLLSSDS